MTSTEIIAGITAIIGAVATAGAFWLSYKQRRNQVTVRCYTGVVLYPERSEITTTIEAVNFGSRPITVSSGGLFLPNEKQLAIDGCYLMQGNNRAAFPLVLSEGASCKILAPTYELAKRLKQVGYSGSVKIVGFYRTDGGGEHVSKALAFDIDKVISP